MAIAVVTIDSSTMVTIGVVGVSKTVPTAGGRGGTRMTKRSSRNLHQVSQLVRVLEHHVCPYGMFGCSSLLVDALELGKTVTS